MSLLSYIKEFCRPGWIKRFLFVKTPPLESPKHFRDFPTVTENACIHCLTCRMICPSPFAVEVSFEDGKWVPKISKGHCIRCGYCVEACPEGVLSSGDLLETRKAQGISFTHEYKILVDTYKCMGCGNCTTACPSNREIEPSIAAGGTASSDGLVIRVERGKNTVLHNELCKGCKVCTDTCPNGAIQVIRLVSAVQEELK